jgi:hypothetical protein
VSDGSLVRTNQTWCRTSPSGARPLWPHPASPPSFECPPAIRWLGPAHGAFRTVPGGVDHPWTPTRTWHWRGLYTRCIGVSAAALPFGRDGLLGRRVLYVAPQICLDLSMTDFLVARSDLRKKKVLLLQHFQELDLII